MYHKNTKIIKKKIDLPPLGGKYKLLLLFSFLFSKKKEDKVLNLEQRNQLK